ncbi:MAG: DNA mismatch repair protein MutS, partial [Bdellovibrionia bacterium]
QTPLARPLTCIRVSDSVRDGVSYFYAETLRLKTLLDGAGPATMYLIDEMFRGTNNRERLIGSQSVVAALIGTKSLGIVTTHDLELTQLERNHTELTNWHFSDDLDPSGLKFSYKINKGPCPSTNALRIMKSLGLPVSVN